MLVLPSPYGKGAILLCHEVFFMEFFQAIANMSGDSLAQHLANGISLGSLYALIAIGYTMV